MIAVLAFLLGCAPKPEPVVCPPVVVCPVAEPMPDPVLPVAVP